MTVVAARVAQAHLRRAVARSLARGHAPGGRARLRPRDARRSPGALQPDRPRVHRRSL